MTRYLQLTEKKITQCDNTAEISFDAFKHITKYLINKPKANV